MTCSLTCLGVLKWTDYDSPLKLELRYVVLSLSNLKEIDRVIMGLHCSMSISCLVIHTESCMRFG